MIPDGVGHSIIVHSLNGVPVTAERVVTASEPNGTVGVGSTLGRTRGGHPVALRRRGCHRRARSVPHVFNASTD